MLKHFAATCMFAAASFAQLPGQYPGNQYPGRGQTIPIPGQRQPSDRSAPQTTRTESTNPITTTGMLRRLSSTEIIIESADHRIIWYRIGDNVRLDSEKFHPGDQLTVTSVEDDEGHYTADSIEWTGAGTPEDRATAAQTWDLPGGAGSRPMPQERIEAVLQEKDERPTLRRSGSPAADTTAPSPREVAQAPAESAPPERVRTTLPPTRADDATIRAARTAAEEYIDALPNFAVRRSTTRYMMQGSRGSWQTLDLVSANLIYRNGTEEYSDIKIGNKSTNKSMDEIDGLHSTGEFGGIMAEILSPLSDTDFGRPSQVEIRGRKAYVYKFETPRERSNWRIETPSQHYYAAYGGAIWFDAETSRVLSIEMQARNLPKAFPFDTVELTMDYDFIRLDTSKQFLVPTESEALNCVRGTSVCMKNTTSFRNYVKFEADSRVIFDDSK